MPGGNQTTMAAGRCVCVSDEKGNATCLFAWPRREGPLFFEVLQPKGPFRSYPKYAGGNRLRCLAAGCLLT